MSKLESIVKIIGYTNIFARTKTHTHTHTHIYTRTHAHAHTHTQAHTEKEREREWERYGIEKGRERKRKYLANELAIVTTKVTNSNSE